MLTKDNLFPVQDSPKHSLSSISALKPSKEKVKAYLSIAQNLSRKDPEKALNLVKNAQSLAEELQYSEGQAEVYNTLGTINWFQSDYDSTITYQNKALEIWKELKDRQGIAKSFKGLGNVHAKLGNYEKALEYYYKALAIHKEKGFQEGIASCYNNIGIVYKNLGEYEKSLECYLKSLRIKEVLNDENGIAYSFNNLGIVLFYLKDYKKALSYHKKALAQFEKTDNKVELANASINIAKTYSKLNHYKKALTNLERSHEIQSELKDRSGMVVSLFQIGEIHTKRRDFEKALLSYSEALDVSKKVNYLECIGECYLRMGEVHFKKGEHKTAIDLLMESIKVNKKAGRKEFIKESFKILSDVYFETGDYLKAHQYKSDYIDLKDEIFNEEKSKMISEMQMKYEAEKKDLEIEKLNLEKKFLRNSNVELEQFASKAAHDLKEPLRMMSNFSGLLLRRYEEKLDEDGIEFLNIIQDASKRMNSLLNSMLEYARTGTNSESLRAVNLEDVMLLVKSNLQLVLTENKAKISYKDLPMVRGTTPNMIQLFQNLISNSLKFRKKISPQIKISYVKKEPFYEFTVKDNGIGIAKEHQSYIFELFHRGNSKEEYDGSGIGLATCKRIIESLGGRIWVESEPGSGTTLFFTLPMA